MTTRHRVDQQRLERLALAFTRSTVCDDGSGSVKDSEDNEIREKGDQEAGLALGRGYIHFLDRYHLSHLWANASYHKAQITQIGAIAIQQVLDPVDICAGRLPRGIQH